MIARRVQAFDVEISTQIEFEPNNFQQMAGLVAYYNTSHYHYLYLSIADNGQKLLNIISCDKYAMTEPLRVPILIENEKSIELKAHIQGASLQFFYKKEDKWQTVGLPLDASILSDDYIQDAENRYRPAFTGMFVGMCCQDLSGEGCYADFDYFEYKEC